MMGKSDRSHPSACASRSSRCAILLLLLRRREDEKNDARADGGLLATREDPNSQVDDALGLATASLNLSGPT
jgi:hypothetical protein